jgi:hypothetical protein
MRSPTHVLPFPTLRIASPPMRAEVGPLRRIELHQVDHDELRSLRARLLKMILDNEQSRKVSRLRLVN